MIKLISVLMSVMIALLSFITTIVKHPEDIAKNIVGDMSLEQKIAQMIMPAFREWKENGTTTDVTVLNKDIKKAISGYGFGGVILFSENCAGTQQTAQLVYDLQAASEIPMLISIDQEGGYITRLQTGTGTVGNMALGAINDYNETKADAMRIGLELSALGINTNFAPSLDVNCNPSNPVIGIRSFSSSPKIVAEMGNAYIDGMHEAGVITSAKHFPGHGDTSTDSHTGLPLINKTYNELKKTELVPFASAIKAGTDMIMTSHIEFPQIEKTTAVSTSTGKKINLPATLSKTIITNILRGDMGFNGVVVTDALNMSAISDNFSAEDAAVLAVNAGVDILLMPVYVDEKSDIAKLGDYIKMIANAVKNGKIKESRINESAERIIALKIKRGLFDERGESINSIVANAKKVVGSKSHHDAEFKTAQKAVTVLKNDGALPIKTSSKSKVLFLYPFSGEEPSIQYGIEQAKNSGVVPSGVESKIYLYRNSVASDYTDTIKNSTAVVVFTEMYSDGYITPGHSNGWQLNFVNDTIKLAHKYGKKVTVVSLNLPYDVAAYTAADALVLAYGAKDIKQWPDKWNGEVRTFGINIPAAVSVLLGAGTPEGKCPVDIPVVKDGKFTDKILYSIGSSVKWTK